MSVSGSLRLDALFGDPRGREIFSDAAFLLRCLAVEEALARALTRCDVIPEGAAAAICAAIELYEPDAAEIAAASLATGAPVAPLVADLRTRVPPEAARFVHFGATTQDVADTATVLQLREALNLLEADLSALRAKLAREARTHRDTLMVARSFLQHAQPTTFGLKCAGYLAALDRHAERLAEMRPRIEVVQFAGAGGTLATYGERGIDVLAALADRLGLGVAAAPWHSARDGVAECGAFLALLCGTLGKIAADVHLMSQTEVAEIAEPSPGTSSAMPHKQNPLRSTLVLAAARKVMASQAVLFDAMVQPHERSLGAWHAEALALPEMMQLAIGALARTRALVDGWSVDAQAMRRNLGTTRGAVLSERVGFALAERLGAGGKESLDRALARLRSGTCTLRDALGEDRAVAAAFSPAELDDLCDPEGDLGAAGAFVDRILAGRE